MARDYRIDSLKGLLIILVIMGHIITTFDNQNVVNHAVMGLIYSFHMPLFILVSGYLTKNPAQQSPREMWRGVFNIFFTLVVFQILSSLMIQLCGGSFLAAIQIIPFGVLWYLMCLIYWRIALYYTPKSLLRRPALYLGIALAASVLIGLSHLGNPFALQRAINFYFFFLLGYYCRQGALSARWWNNNALHAVVALVALPLLFWLFPEELMALFDSPPEMVAMGVVALHIISLNFPFAGYAIMRGAAFQALGKSVYSKETKEVYASGPATVQADFRAYKSWQDSVSDHSAYLLGARKGSTLRYEGLKDCKDYRKAAQIIKDGGYATSPTYVEKLCSIIEEWKLTQYDTATTPAKVEEKASTAMAITIYVPGFTTSRSDERHGDGMVIHSESGQTLVIDGFDGGAPTKSLIRNIIMRTCT